MTEPSLGIVATEQDASASSYVFPVNRVAPVSDSPCSAALQEMARTNNGYKFDEKSEGAATLAATKDAFYGTISGAFDRMAPPDAQAQS
jgi:hypothetical protein